MTHRIIVGVMTFAVGASGCLAPEGHTPVVSITSASSPKLEAERKMRLLRTTAAYSLIHRVSIPAQEMAPWVSLVREIEAGLEVDPDQQFTAQERREIRVRKSRTENRNVSILADVVIEKIGFERMHVREDATIAVGDGATGKCEGKARLVNTLDEHSGRPMCVFEPTIFFDDSVGGYIFVDLTVQWGVPEGIGRRHAGRKPRRSRRPLQCAVRVTIHGASIPVDVFYDDQIGGVEVNPERRKDEFRIGECEVEVRTLGAIPLPKGFRRISREIISKRFGDEVTAGIQEAVSSLSFRR